MAMRMSTLFLRTLREDPVDAEVPSHRLLVRAGYIRRAAPGIYSWLPLGLKVLRNVERVVREEMGAIGAQELLFPALLPKEPYEASGRYTEYGDNIFTLDDRKGAGYLLGPTHEELFTMTVKDLYSSYKDLPLSLYQIQTKYRDESRPRAGILRGREFVMKDSYSFDVSDEKFLESYEAHRSAYVQIFDRLGLDYVIVAAMSGAMGGSASEEFLANAVNGEDTYVRCTSCDYAANVEAVRVPVPEAVPYDDAPAAHVEDTPDTPTIETLVAHLNAKYPREDRPWEAGDTLKNVIVVVAHGDGRREPLAIGVPGDREVDLKRLGAQVEPAEVEAFDEAAFAANSALAKGYIGPRALGEERASGIRYLLDPRVVAGTRWVTGADEQSRHVLDLVAGRDFTGDGVIEAAEVREGDACPNCGHALESARGIELAHIFQLGRKYADALGLQVLDENGKLVTVTMGSYGVGVSRAVAAIVEGSYDDAGIIWPREVAPADVHIVATGKDPAVFEAADRLTTELEAAGVSVLYDDRPKVSPGV
ncbi:MAG: proline--tRNA ligase, partial [Nocardioidaceae bacterium]